MNVRFINPFIRSCHLLFNGHLGMNVKVDKPHLKKRSDPPLENGIVIDVSLTGSVEGQVKLLFAESVALALANALLMTTDTKVSASTYDALREVANMIVGKAKQDFPGEATRFSIPKVVSSQVGDWKYDRHVLVVPLISLAGAMRIEVSLASAKQPAPVIVDPDVNQGQVDELVAKLLREQESPLQKVA